LGVVEGGVEGERGARERAEAELEGVSGRVWDLEREKGELSGEVLRLKGEMERRSKELEKVRSEGIRRVSAVEEEARTAREAADKHEKVSERIMSSLSSLKGHLDAVGLAPARRLLLDSQGEGAKEEGEDEVYDAEAVVAGARSCLRELKERRDECLTLGDEVKAMKTQVEELGRLAEERRVDAQSTMRKNEKLSGEVETHDKRAESLSKMGQRAKGASQELGMLVNRLRSLRQDAEGGG
jgi:chromosome segregation ATPase